MTAELDGRRNRLAAAVRRIDHAIAEGTQPSPALAWLRKDLVAALRLIEIPDRPQRAALRSHTLEDA